MKSERFQICLTGIFFALIFLITASVSFAGPDRTTYQAKIIKPDGNPLEASGVNFKFTIMDAAATCVLYSETYSGVNMNSTGGLISFSLGSGVKTYPVSGTTFAQVFSNITPNLACDAAGTPTVYTPSATDGRKIVMQFNDGNGWQTLPAMSINAVPYAMYADNSTKFSGMVPSEFVQVSTIPTCLASEALRYTGASFNCVAVGSGGASVTSGSVITALGYTPADGTSVTTLISNVTNVSSTVFSVSSTVSSLASNVAASFSAITSSQWATSGTDVYYTFGNVGIGTSTPTSVLSLEASGTANLLSLTTSTNVNLRMKSTSVSGTEWNFASIGTAAGREGNFEIQDNTRNRRPFMIAPQTGTSAPGYSLVISSSGSVGVGTIAPLTKLDVSGAIRIGYENNCGASYTGVIRYNGGALEYCNGSAWNALGVSGAGLTLLNGSASSTQSFAIGVSGNSPAFVSANGVHTLDIPLASAAGSVTAGLLSNADYVAFGSKMSATSAAIAAALGYVPANPVSVTTVENSLSSFTTSVAASFSAITSSQWETSGTTINYSLGNVGIGTSAPAAALDVYGSVRITGNTTSGINLFSTANNAIFGLNRANDVSNGSLQISAFGGIGFTPASAGTNVTSGSSLFIATSGNVGVGTVTPVRGLHYNGTGHTVFHITNSATGQSISDGIDFYADADGTSAVLRNNENGPLIFGTSNTERIRISGNGNFGIGTTNPIQLLSIVGNNSPTIIISNSAARAIGNRETIQFAIDTAQNQHAQIYAENVGGGNGAAALGFGTWDGTSLTEKLRISSAGNVGIGTSAPTSILTVGVPEATTISTGANAISLFSSGSAYVLTRDTANDIEFAAGASSSGGEAFSGSMSSHDYSLRTGNSTRIYIKHSTAAVGFGTTTPTGRIHMAAGSSSLAPLKFTSGTLLSSAQSGTMEYDGFNFYLTDGTNTRRAISLGSSAGSIDNASTINSTGNITMVPVGSVVVSSTTASTNSTTGALVVRGGLGIAGDIYSSGTIVTSSNIQGVSVTATSGITTPVIQGTQNLLINPNGGNVGIGTTIPSATVHVYNSNNSLQTATMSYPGENYSTGPSSASIFSPAGAVLTLGNTSATTSAAALVYFSTRNNNGYQGAYIGAMATNNAPTNTPADIVFGQRQAASAWVERMRITSTGSVGIGTATPTASLTVVGNVLVNNRVNISSDNTGGGLSRIAVTNGSLALSGGSMDASNGNGNHVMFYTNAAGASSTEKMRVTDTGNVGIGTTAPTTSLHIYSASATPLVVERSNAQNANILFKNTANSMFAGIAQSGSFGIGTTNNLDSSALLIVSGTSGNIGIGTTSPAAKWHVSNGNGALPSLGSTIYLMQNNANVTDNTVTTLISGVSGTGQISFGDAGAVNQGAIRYDHATDSLGLYSGGFSNGERLTINATGNVGLGTTTPTARLQITQGTGSLAPLKFTSGTLLTSAQSGTMEYDGFNFYLTDGSNTRRSIALGSAAGSIDNASTINSTGNITMVPVGSVVVSSTTASTNSSTGSLVVRGGLGVAGNIYSSGTIVTSSNIQGASVTATSGVSTTVIQGVPYLALNPNGGNVGVGTTTPAFKLAVSGGLISNHSFFPSLYLVDNDAATSSTIGGVLRLQDENGNIAAAFGIPNSNNIVMMDARDSSGQIGFRTGGTNERMRIDSSGNVGIGTTSPVAKLDVSATTTATSGFNVGTNSYLYVMPSANQVVAVSNSNIANYGYTEIPAANTRNINTIYGTGGDAYNYSSNVSIQSMYGAYGMAYNNGANVTVNGEMAGGWAMAMNDRAATIDQMYGWWGGSQVTSGTVNYMTGVWGQSDAYGSSTVSNMYGLRVNSVVSNAVVGNRYGLHIAMTGSTTNSSNDYAIYSQSGQKSFLSGRLGLGVSDVTARLQISSGTTSVAPLKFASGALLTSAQSGSMEYDGFNFYLTDGTNTRRSIATGSSAGTIDNASNVNSTGNITMTPTGSVVVSSTTASTNSTTGALVVRGGLGVAGNIYSSGTIITSSNMQAASFTATGTISSARMIVDGGSSVQLKMEPNAQAYGYQINTSGTVGTWAREFSFSHNDGKIGAIGMLATNGVPNYLYFSANVASATTAHLQPQMVLNSAGSLGLGVTSMTRKLEISSTDGDGIPAFYVSENSVTSSQYVGQFHADNASFNSTVLRLSSDRISSSAYNFIESIIDADGTSSTAFVVRGDGNVGIGTTSPQVSLQVDKNQDAGTIMGVNNPNSGTSARASMVASNNGVNTIFISALGSSHTASGLLQPNFGVLGIEASYNGLNIGTMGSNDPINFYTANTSRVTIDGSGNVGIGTSAPTTTLDIQSSDGIAPTLRLANDGTTTGAAKITLFRNTNDFAEITQVLGGGTTGGLVINSHRNTGDANILFRTSGSEKMRIMQSGNVGIGTTAPAHSLDVQTTSNTTLRIRSAANLDSSVILTENDSTHGMVMKYIGGGNTRGAFIVRQGVGTDIEAMSIGRSTGHIGIGTSSPTTPLTVSGVVRSISGGFQFPDGSTQETAVGVGYGMAYSTSGSTVAVTTTWTDVSLSGGNVGLNGISHNTGVNPARMAVSTAGTYEISYSISFTQTSTGATICTRLRVNGTTPVMGGATCRSESPGSTFAGTMARTVMVTLAANDYVTLQAYANANSVFNLASAIAGISDDAPSILTIKRLGN